MACCLSLLCGEMTNRLWRQRPRLFQIGDALQAEKLLSKAFPPTFTLPANAPLSKVDLCPLPVPF